MIRRAALVTVVVVLACASPAGAGAVGSTVEASTAGALAIAVSRAYFPDGTSAGVVVTDPGAPALAAVAVAFAGGLEGRMPVLFSGHGVSDAALRGEIARATGGPDRPGGATVWLAGATVPGLVGYDVRDLGDTVAEVSASVIGHGAAAGTGNRVLVFDADNWQAGVVAAGFGAAYGVPVVTAGGLPEFSSVFKPVAIVIGKASVPADRFSRVDTIEGDDPAALSAAVATKLVAKENPAGAARTVPVPTEPVSADGYRTDAGPALLAPVVAAALQTAGARPTVLLVDARPTTDLAKGCAAGGRDAPSLCLMDKSDGQTTVLALTAVGRSDAAPSSGRLPPTGGSGLPAVLGGALIMAVVITRRGVLR